MLHCAGNTLGLPSTLYVGEAGRDVRDVKLLELGFVAVQKGRNLVLRNTSNSTTNVDNDSGMLRPLNAGGRDNSKVAAISTDKIPVVECDDLQIALAVAAFQQWKCIESITDTYDRWRSYIARLQKELNWNKTEWNEVQALYTVDEQRFTEGNVKGP